ncbi:MAG: amidophosphoribosyltransferase [Spirochaetaceae bacterium]|jgi:amidophosphoribosyltransferase|nr:amidophosphoribosyltransferase [Spirochaetaceae bacterium]
MIHEECGLFGIYAARSDDGVGERIAALCYAGLYALQHRGQESCGIAVKSAGGITNRRDMGLAGDVFTPAVLASLGDNGRGQMAVAHVRYGTTGINRRSNAQPFVAKHIKGSIALAHNGNLTNAGELRRTLEMRGNIFHTSSDTEAIIYTIVRERLNSESIEEAVKKAMYILEGAYSLILMSHRKLIAVRDSNGFRPLCMGRLGNSVVFASESCALSAVGAEFVRDIQPGEIVVAGEDGIHSITTHCGGKSSLCVFEYVYFARPDSVIDGVSVHEARLKAGEILAREHPADVDVVIGVPDSGLDAALGFSRASGIPFDFGFLKNKYIARTFISPDAGGRAGRVRLKLNPIETAVKGKRVVMVDDSIVRGTTSMQIIRLLREAGAKEVHIRLSCPPFLYPCYFGTDIDRSENLIAHNHTLFEIKQIIGADSIGYLSIEGLSEMTRGCSSGLCTACFSGDYPVDISKIGEKDLFEREIDTD